MTEIIDRPQISQIHTPSSHFNISSFRDPETQAAYFDHRERKQALLDDSCDMCERPNKEKINKGLLEIIEKDFSLFENDFAYFHYDGFKVTDHDLLVPKEHISDLRKLSPDAKAALMEALMYVDATQAYDLYLKRGPESAASSIPAHAHYHLMNLDQTQKVIQHTFCDECNVVSTSFKGQLHTSHS